MANKQSNFISTDFRIDKFQINKLRIDSLSLNYELNVQDYFRKIDKKSVSSTQTNKFRTYETEWENINQPITEDDPFINGIFYAWKGWNVDLGNIPDIYIPFIDVKTLWRNSGFNDNYVPAVSSKGYYFTQYDTEDDNIKHVYLHASIYFFEDTRFLTFGGQSQSTNTSVDVKLLVTFLYPYNII